MQLTKVEGKIILYLWSNKNEEDFYKWQECIIFRRAPQCCLKRFCGKRLMKCWIIRAQECL